MRQVFRPRANAVARAILILLPLVGVILWSVTDAYRWSSYVTDQNVPQKQPIPFSHKHHVGGLGMDCRYCHTTVERSAFAGMPATETCMSCHSQIWRESPMLEPVRQSYRQGKPIAWNRVHKLPDFVYFNHSIHVQKGVTCADCHGEVEKMPLMWKARTFYMRDCLSCHRDPEGVMKHPLNPAVLTPTSLTSCYTCHR